MDVDHGGGISVQELEGPLLSTGIAKSKDEVESLIASVDKDGSKEIGLQEFIQVLTAPVAEEDEQAAPEERAPAPLPERRKKRDAPASQKKANPIIELQNMQDNGALSMDTILSQQRRQLIIDAVMSDSVNLMAEQHTNEMSFEVAKKQADTAQLEACRIKKESIVKQIKSRNEFLASMKRVVDNSFQVQKDIFEELEKQRLKDLAKEEDDLMNLRVPASLEIQELPEKMEHLDPSTKPDSWYEDSPLIQDEAAPKAKAVLSMFGKK